MIDKSMVNRDSLDWYEYNIEEPVRDLVKHLRNNGINTECSCAHEMYIQCQFIPDGSIHELHRLLYCYFTKKKEKVNFEINMNHKVVNGCQYSSLHINLTGKEKHIDTLKKRKKYLQKRIQSIDEDLERIKK